MTSRSNNIDDQIVSQDMRVVSNRVVGDLMVEVGGEEHRWGASDSREIEMVVERKRRQKLYTLEDGGGAQRGC